MEQTPLELRNSAARRLIGRRRFREALDVLNEAIRLDPRYAESYENRAIVFEAMGMYPQADADRRKFADLGGTPKREEPAAAAPPPTYPPIDDEPPTERGDPGPAPAPGGPPPSLPPRYPAARGRPSPWGRIIRSLGVVLITIGLFVAAGIGIFIALNQLSDALDDDNGGVANPTATPDTSASPGETDGPDGSEAPSPTQVAPEEALEGSPLSFDQLEEAWDNDGITASPGDVAESVTGMTDTPVRVTLSRTGDAMELAVLLYDSTEERDADWDINARPVAPRAGRSVPAGSRIWFNRNAIVVVLQSSDSMHEDALAAFLDAVP